MSCFGVLMGARTRRSVFFDLIIQSRRAKWRSKYRRERSLDKKKRLWLRKSVRRSRGGIFLMRSS